jgi:hypothetical protein
MSGDDGELVQFTDELDSTKDVLQSCLEQYPDLLAAGQRRGNRWAERL